MGKKHKVKYISNRIFFLGILTIGGMIFLGLALLALSFRGEAPLWIALMSLLFAAALIAAWMWIVLPYQRYEKMVRRFLDGYLIIGEMNESVMLTPSARSQMEKIDQIIRSPQLMDLNKRQAQYLALQNQINPHFLYNTLESIRGEALIAGLDSVADMTESLAKFFRYTITKVENLVSVEEELDNCETYYWIQKYRFGDRLQLHVEYGEEEKEEILSCRIPKLTLQPILENSIIHGTELKIGTGNLCIRFERTEKRLIIHITDDGVGMDEETLRNLNRKFGKMADTLTPQEEEKKGGIALANVDSRIRLIFGDEYGLHVYSEEGSGTDVEIAIPIVTRGQQIENDMAIH